MNADRAPQLKAVVSCSLTIDFVQFADGTIWFSNLLQSTVKPDGLRAGAKAAANYQLAVMSRDGVQAVMTNLPRIHADVRAPIGAANNPEFGIFGFYSGVTNTAVRVEHEYKGGGAERVVRFPSLVPRITAQLTKPCSSRLDIVFLK